MLGVNPNYGCTAIANVTPVFATFRTGMRKSGMSVQATAMEISADWNFWLNVADKVIKALAVGFGGWWTLRIYRLDSTHNYRLQAEVKAEFATRHGRDFVLVTCQLRNVGRTSTPLRKMPHGPLLDGSGLTVGLIRPKDADDVVTHLIPLDEDTRWINIFVGHHSVEPGLTISDQVLIPKPAGSYDGCRALLRIVTPGRRGSDINQQWVATAVAVKE